MTCECVLCKNNNDFEIPKEILDACYKEELVIFCGAGISTESKNVLPYSFYTEIAKELETSTDLEFSVLMQKYCELPNGRKKLLKKIQDRFNYIHSFPELERQATRFHEELQELHFIKTIITTNWDTYFEDFCGAIPITIPEDYACWSEDSRCVLKIHGSINNISTVVATTDDYKQCLERLQKGIIGAKLKTILASKTVVFIGYSFGDEDFNHILNYMREEMKDFLPHIYVVTLDEKLKDKLDYAKYDCLVTDGTYFLHQIKKKLVDEGFIENSGLLPIIHDYLREFREIHSKISEIDFRENPYIIYCLAYQDGVIHSLERFIKMYHRGEYNSPNMLFKLIKKYDNMCKKYKEAGNYWDESYYEGYLNGLLLIHECGREDDIEGFPFVYLPNLEFDSYDDFMNKLAESNEKKDDYYKLAEQIVNNYSTDDIVIHHPPY